MAGLFLHVHTWTDCDFDLKSLLFVIFPNTGQWLSGGWSLLCVANHEILGPPLFMHPTRTTAAKVTRSVPPGSADTVCPRPPLIRTTLFATMTQVQHFVSRIKKRQSMLSSTTAAFVVLKNLFLVLSLLSLLTSLYAYSFS